MKKINKDVIRLGNLSTGKSQAGTIYQTRNTISPTICAGTHGYAIGYILQKRKARKQDE